jgi:hypothetical protein
MKKHIKGKQSKDPDKPDYTGKKKQEGENDLEGYPEYPADEDIYKKYRHESEINPEEPARPKIFNTQDDTGEADNAELSGKDLDIPGAELDDEQEEIGAEDEENNYYSLGGENHENLEENGDEQ